MRHVPTELHDVVVVVPYAVRRHEVALVHREAPGDAVDVYKLHVVGRQLRPEHFGDRADHARFQTIVGGGRLEPDRVTPLVPRGSSAEDTSHVPRPILPADVISLILKLQHP